MDLEASSIRPGNGREWHRAMRCRIHREVAASSADITIHCGNWLHDLRQVRQLRCLRAAWHSGLIHQLRKARMAMQQPSGQVGCSVFLLFTIFHLATGGLLETCVGFTGHVH